MAKAPSPALPQQRVCSALHVLLSEQLRDCQQCEALFEADVEFSDDTVVRPDVLVICFAHEGERITRRPA